MVQKRGFHGKDKVDEQPARLMQASWTADFLARSRLSSQAFPMERGFCARSRRTTSNLRGEPEGTLSGLW